jgi:hypothetical protein
MIAVISFIDASPLSSLVRTASGIATRYDIDIIAASVPCALTW